LAVTDAPGLRVLGFTLLVGDRQGIGRLVKLGDHAVRHPRHMGAIERDEWRLGIGVGPHVYYDQLSAVQPFKPRTTPTAGIQIALDAVREVGETRAGDVS
jgi:hypothetical protein